MNADTTSDKEYLFINNQEIIHFIQWILYDISIPATEQQIQQHMKMRNSSTVPGVILSAQKTPLDITANHNTVFPDFNSTNIAPLLFQLQGEHRVPRLEYEDFWVNTESKGESSEVGNNRSFFIDLGVYTRNRAF